MRSSREDIPLSEAVRKAVGELVTRRLNHVIEDPSLSEAVRVVVGELVFRKLTYMMEDTS